MDFISVERPFTLSKQQMESVPITSQEKELIT